MNYSRQIPDLLDTNQDQTNFLSPKCKSLMIYAQLRQAGTIRKLLTTWNHQFANK